jgi:hypothetical protein
MFENQSLLLPEAPKIDVQDADFIDITLKTAAHLIAFVMDDSNFIFFLRSGNDLDDHRFEIGFRSAFSANLSI